MRCRVVFLAATLAVTVLVCWAVAQHFNSCLGFPGEGPDLSMPALLPRGRDFAWLDSAEGDQDDLEEWMFEDELQEPGGAFVGPPDDQDESIQHDGAVDDIAAAEACAEAEPSPAWERGAFEQPLLGFDSGDWDSGKLVVVESANVTSWGSFKRRLNELDGRGWRPHVWIIQEHHLESSDDIAEAQDWLKARGFVSLFAPACVHQPEALLAASQ